jgi:hypothetical protein
MMLCALSCIVNGTNYEEGGARSSHELQPTTPDLSRATQDTLVEGAAVTINTISGEPFSVIDVRRDTTLADVYEQIRDKLDSEFIYNLIIDTNRLRLRNTNEALPEDSWTMTWQITFSLAIPKLYFRFNPLVVNHKTTYISILQDAVARFILRKYRDWNGGNLYEDPERYPLYGHLYKYNRATCWYTEGDYTYQTLEYCNAEGQHDHHLVVLGIYYDWDKSEGFVEMDCNRRNDNDKTLLQMIPEEDRKLFLEEVMQDININRRREFIEITMNNININWCREFIKITNDGERPLTTDFALDDYPPYPTGPLFNREV